MYMRAGNETELRRCGHSAQESEGLLAVITIGNSTRGDEGIAEAVCNALPKSALNGVCRFDLGMQTACLGQCLSGHKAAIIIDSTQNGSAPGTVSIIDLSSLLNKATPIKLDARHGLSLADELRMAKKMGHIPARLIFFGVEVDDTSLSDGLSTALNEKVPHLARQLSPMVTKMVETLKKNA
jgi:hydrogenase maturation protease